jgi:hypothetical protein
MWDLFVAIAALLAGLSTGFTAPQTGIFVLVAVVLLLYLQFVLGGRAPDRFMAGLDTVTVSTLVLLAGSVIGGVAGVTARNPVVLLYAFWLYALVATGYMASRCCLGWHVGASAAVLTGFVAIGLLLQSLMAGGVEWLVLGIFAVGMWWGADSWRRANGLAINE